AIDDWHASVNLQRDGAGIVIPAPHVVPRHSANTVSKTGSAHVWALNCLLQRGNDMDQHAERRKKATAPLLLTSLLNFQAKLWHG
ncbi:MAG: hypothetical protein WBE03_01995, partial [Terracidiphilus sp.]